MRIAKSNLLDMPYYMARCQPTHMSHLADIQPQPMEDYKQGRIFHKMHGGNNAKRKQQCRLYESECTYTLLEQSRLAFIKTVIVK